MSWDWFDTSEFDSPDEPGSGRQIDRTLVDKLDAIRARLGCALIVTSGVRTASYNLRVGGAVGSAHLVDAATGRAHAADLASRIADGAYGWTARGRFDFLALAFALGIARVGIGEDFIHVDSHPRHAAACWLYAGARARWSP